MSAIIETYTLSGCSDCRLFIANGDQPEDDDTLPARIDAEWSVSDETCDQYGAVRGSLWFDIVDGGEHVGFSWKPCECCGSHLGGDRYSLTAILRRK
jgi:hypothetical protein